MKGKIIKKKGNFFIKEINGTKEYPILLIKDITDEFIDKECEFEINSTFVQKIIIGNTEYTKEGAKTVEKRKENQKQRVKIEQKKYQEFNPNQNSKRAKSEKQDKASLEPSKAPYNFVPLNKKVVLLGQIADIPVEELLKEKSDLENYKGFSTYHENLNTGYIELEIETITPLYIRDGLDENDLKENKETKDKSDFFSIDGKPQIPGSSIRGLVRTLVEIVSFGKFNNFEDKRLFFRAVADKSSFGNYYRDLLNGKVNGKEKYEILSGLLRKNGKRNYSIHRFKSKKFYRVEVNWISNDKFKVNGKEFEIFKYKPVYYDKNNIITGKSLYSQQHPIIRKIELEPGLKPAFLVTSGRVGNNKKTQWVLDREESGDTDRLSLQNIEEYKEDKNRNSINLLEKNEYPVFYLKEKNSDKLKAFGHTRFFRVPYEKKISDHIPNSLRENAKPDFAEAIFGKESKWASRVYFEDAKILSKGENLFIGETIPHVLSSPKPTAFQHYLEQKGVFGKERKHWDSEGTNIRGYKLYWHKNINKEKNYWIEKNPKNKKVITKINPIKKGVKFKGKIRFENLSDEELGALLFVLSLPENHYHKIGMAKPLGLGSIKITPKLVLVDNKRRYESLFDNNNWNTAEKEESLEKFKKAFEEFIKKQLQFDKPLWEHKRMKELKAMLNWKNTEKSNWLDITDYLELKEFKDRNILEDPTYYENL